MRVQVCNGGAPNKSFTDCLKFDEISKEDKNFIGAENCLWGARSSSGELGCYKCKQGFVSKIGNDYSYAGNCVSLTSLETKTIQFPGCLRIGEAEGYDIGRCLLCDFDSGFTMKNYHGQCSVSYGM